MKKINLVDRRFGRLVIMREVEHKKKMHRRWECKCDCGNTVVVEMGSLRNGRTKSCGCLKNELLSKLLKGKIRPKEVGVKVSATKAERRRPNNFRIKEGVCYIELCDIKGRVVGETLIDLGEYDKIKDLRFHLNDKGYAKASAPLYTKLHHIIIGKPPKGLFVDHINRNRLDNRKCNLRFVNCSQNIMNSAPIKNKTSKYKGVSWRKTSNKWAAGTSFHNKKIYLGLFNNEIEAAEAYDRKVLELYGNEYVVLNFFGGQG